MEAASSSLKDKRNGPKREDYGGQGEDGPGDEKKAWFSRRGKFTCLLRCHSAGVRM